MDSLIATTGKNISLMLTGIALWLILSETGVIKTKGDQISDMVEAGSEVTITAPEVVAAKRGK